MVETEAPPTLIPGNSAILMTIGVDVDLYIVGDDADETVFVDIVAYSAAIDSLS